MVTETNLWHKYRIMVWTYGIGMTGALLFAALELPLAWLLGALTAVLIWQQGGKQRTATSSRLRDLASVLFGYLLGSSFTREGVLMMGCQLPYMMITTITIIALSIGIGTVTTRIARIDRISGLLGSVPGGLPQMVLLSEEMRVRDVSSVTLLQTVRLLTVIFVVPFLAVHGLGGDAAASEGTLSAGASDWEAGIVLLFSVAVAAGWWGGKWIRLPAATLTGPLLATAMVTITAGIAAPPLPEPLLLFSQLVFGAYLGQGIHLQNLRQTGALILCALLGNLFLLLLVFGVGRLLADWAGFAAGTGFLSAAPGGVVEMGLTAELIGADLATVSSYQLFRLFFIMFAMPPLLRWWIGRRSRPRSNNI